MEPSPLPLPGDSEDKAPFKTHCIPTTESSWAQEHEAGSSTSLSWGLWTKERGGTQRGLAFWVWVLASPPGSSSDPSFIHLKLLPRNHVTLNSKVLSPLLPTSVPPITQTLCRKHPSPSGTTDPPPGWIQSPHLSQGPKGEQACWPPPRVNPVLLFIYWTSPCLASIKRKDILSLPKGK